MPLDFSDALETSQPAAEAGDPAAQYRMGVMRGFGLGLPQDYAQAVAWYRRAAEQGHPEAQAALGWMYGTGRGIPQDYVHAYAWYSMAAAQGHETGRWNRDLLEERMSPTQVAQAQALAARLFGGG